jgi:cytochrome c oxidase assembly protein subunit 15
MFVVLVMGATVTNTNSAEGCGRSWPLCHGQLIPEFAVSTFIELSHRAATGIETVLVFATAIGAWMLYRRHPEVRVLAPLMVGFLLLQAVMGAWAVLYPQTPIILALHFGISLVAFASATTLAVVLRSVGRTDSLRAQTVSPAYRRFTWGILLYSFVVVYLGAYMRHTGIDLACRGWPLCNGEVFPGLDGPWAIAFAHRFAALLLAAGLVALAAWSRSTGRADLWNGSLLAVAMVILQSASGILVVFTGVGLWSALSHAGVMALLFASVCYVCLRALPPLEKQDPAPEQRRLTARSLA